MNGQYSRIRAAKAARIRDSMNTMEHRSRAQQSSIAALEAKAWPRCVEDIARVYAVISYIDGRITTGSHGFSNVARSTTECASNLQDFKNT